MRQLRDETGHKYGRFVVIGRSGSKNKRAVWECLCTCGETRFIRGDYLRSGRSTSCGCFNKEKCWKHGHSPRKGFSRTYSTWHNMRQRCYNSNYNRFYDYGGRGIQVCVRWFDFRNFLSDLGERPVGMSIDRINPDGHYVPSNCRWATPKEQAKNKRSYGNN